MTTDERRWDAGRERITIAEHLSAIEDAYARLIVEVTHHAADPEIPGGMAMVMLGPGADVEAWSYREMSAILGRAYAEESMPGEVEPPLSFLAGWSDIVRSERGQEPSTKRAAIAREVHYLRSALDWMLALDGEGAPWWMPVESFAQDLAIVRRTLERVIGNGPQVDRGATCIRCEAGTRLERQWSNVRGEHAYEADIWECRQCGATMKWAEYLQAAKAEYLAKAKWLSGPDAAAMYRIAEGTIRRWVHEDKVRKKHDPILGRIVYCVKQIMEQREIEHAEAVDA